MSCVVGISPSAPMVVTKQYVPGTPPMNFKSLYPENVWDGPVALEKRATETSPVLAALWASKVAKKSGVTLGQEIFSRVNCRLQNFRAAEKIKLDAVPRNCYGFPDEIFRDKKQRLERERVAQAEAESAVIKEVFVEIDQDVVMSDANSVDTKVDEVVSAPAYKAVESEVILEVSVNKSPISILYETFGQARISFSEGPGYPFESIVFLDGVELGRAVGNTKKDAKAGAAKGVVAGFGIVNRKSTEGKIHCAECGFFVNPDGHSDRCNLPVKPRFFGPEFIFGKFIGDRLVSLHLGLLYGVMVGNGALKDRDFGNLTVWGSMQWSNANMVRFAKANGLELDLDRSDHTVGDQFEYLYYRDKALRKMFLRFIVGDSVGDEVIDRIVGIGVDASFLKL